MSIYHKGFLGSLKIPNCQKYIIPILPYGILGILNDCRLLGFRPMGEFYPTEKQSKNILEIICDGKCGIITPLFQLVGKLRVIRLDNRVIHLPSKRFSPTENNGIYG